MLEQQLNGGEIFKLAAAFGPKTTLSLKGSLGLSNIIAPGLPKVACGATARNALSLGRLMSSFFVPASRRREKQPRQQTGTAGLISSIRTLPVPIDKHG